MHSQKLFLGLPKVSCTDGVCPGCVISKQHQDSFPKGKALHATKPLKLVHNDFMIFPIHSFSGSKYVLTFIDDFLCISWVYFLKYKSEILDTFKTFKDFVEKPNPLFLSRIYAQIIGGSMLFRHSLLQRTQHFSSTLCSIHLSTKWRH